MGAMDAGEAEQAMRELRLRRALEEHIEETEQVPVEVRRAAREVFPEREEPSPK